MLTSPQPSEESIGKYYLSDKYISHTGGGKNLFDIIYLYARRVALKWKRRIVEKSSIEKTILDFGCGTGEFLEEMKTHGWATAGVEPSSIASASAKKKSARIYQSLAEIHQQAFDAITLWHVLEHVHDLNGTLKKLRELLKKNGTIFIAVPNYESADAQSYQSHWAAYDVPRHLWHFSKNNMKQLLESNGFRLVEILPMKMDSFYVSLLSETYRYPKHSNFVNLIKAFFMGLSSNRKAKKQTNFSSLIYIAKK